MFETEISGVVDSILHDYQAGRDIDKIESLRHRADNSTITFGMTNRPST